MKGRVEKHGKTWRYRVDIGRRADGKRDTVTKSGYLTKKEASTDLAILVADLSKGTFIRPTKVSVAEYLEAFFEEWKHTVSPAHYEVCRVYARAYVVPTLGNIRLSDVTPARLNRLYGKLLERLAPETVRNVHRFLRRALRDAPLVSNPAAKSTPPRPQRGPVSTWDAETLQEFLQRGREHRDWLAWVILASTGMRRSECLRLEWRDVDLDRGVIRIGQSKTPAGRREVSVDAGTVSVLRQFHEGQGDVTNAGSPNRFTHRFADQVKKLELPHLTVHGLRHTHASLLLKEGVHPKVVQERLGHSSIRVTLDVYSHVIPSMGHDAANTFGPLLWSPNGHQRSGVAPVGSSA